MFRKGKDTISEIADNLDRSYKSVERKAYKIGDGLTTNLTKIKDIPNNVVNVETSKKVKGIDIINLLKDNLHNMQEASIRIETPKKKPDGGDTLIVHFTDWHIGRIVKDEDGNEVYNMNIFKDRVHKLLREIITLLDLYITKGTPITDVVILSTGDILDGMGIFSSQEVSSEASPPFQVMLAVEVIQNFILALTDRKLNVSFYGVKGNHGEIREGGKSKDPNANWDLMLYLILNFWAMQTTFENKINVYYSELDYLNLSIQGWKYHIRHKAPQQSDTPAGKAKFLGWARKHQCHVLVYGHYHHYGIGDRSGVTVIRGGSLTGSDEYSEQLAEESEPIQLLWGCCKDRPVTFMYAIDLGQRKQK
jgi:predicted phosphodiesterase